MFLIEVYPLFFCALILEASRVRGLEANDGAILKLEDLIRDSPFLNLSFRNKGFVGSPRRNEAVIEVFRLNSVAANWKIEGANPSRGCPVSHLYI